MTASRSAADSRRQVCTVSTRSARRQVPAISPSTSRAPGQTRGVHSASRGARRPGPAARGRRPGAGSRRRRWGAAGPAPRARARRGSAASSSARIHASPIGCPHRRQRACRAPRTPPRPPRRRSPPSRRTPPAWPGRRRAGSGAPARGGASRGIDLRRRHGPDHRLPRALPPDQHRAGRGRVPEHVGVHAERVPRLRVGHPRGRRGPRRRRAARSSARRRRPGLVGQPSRARRPPGRAAATTKTLNRGPHSWTSDGSSQVDGSVPSTRAWIDSSAARGMLSCSPAQAARRSEPAPGRKPLVERADVPPEGQDLRPREAQPIPVTRLASQPYRPRQPGSQLIGEIMPPLT